MPTRRIRNLTYRDNMTPGELAAWHRQHPDAGCAAFPARAMLAKARVVTLRDVMDYVPPPATVTAPDSLPTTPASTEDAS